MRKFWTLLKTLIAFRSLRVRNRHQYKLMSVAYCNPALNSSTFHISCTTTNNFNLTVEHDSAPAESFFLHLSSGHPSYQSAPLYPVIKSDLHKQQYKKIGNKIILINTKDKIQNKYFLTVSPANMKMIFKEYQSWVFALLFALLVLICSVLGQWWIENVMREMWEDATASSSLIIAEMTRRF